MMRAPLRSLGCKRTWRGKLGVLLYLAVLPLAGCDDIIGGLTDSYTGPPPETRDIVGETAVVRRVNRAAGTGILVYYLDRTRYMESEPKSMNRVIRASAEEVQSVAEALRLQVGDRVKFSTRFGHLEGMAGLGEFVPNWPYGLYYDHQIAVHHLTALERVSP